MRFKKQSLFGLAMMVLGGCLVGVAYQHSHATPPICQTIKTPFAHHICTYTPNQKHLKLSLYWQGADGKPLLNFSNLISQQSQNQIIFAVNAGMYDHQYAPIGYTVIEGRQILSLNLNTGSGNFHLMPNGVFWWDKTGVYISESHQMARLLKQGKQPLFATQSGPMLVIDGQIHPKFDPASTSLKMRNGVGICRDGKVIFVNSAVAVNFYQFAQLFKQTLHCENALFLDGGRASALYSTELKHHDKKMMGVMIALSATPKP